MASNKRWTVGAIATALLVSVTVFAQEGSQQKAVPDAQVESNVLKALAGAPELSDQAIGTTTVYGTVTITGSVKDEASRDKAEQIVANTPGVKKVVDELVIGEPAPPSQNGATQAAQPAQDQQGADPADQNMSEPAMQGDASAQQGMPAQDPAAQMPPRTQTYPPQQGYPSTYRQPQAWRPQQAGLPVTLPMGTYLRVRVNQGMDSRHTQPGTPFDGTVTNQVVLGGSVAVPRGAQVQGQVVEVHPGGDLKGRGVLALQLTQITLEGHAYPLATDPWSHQGYDKTGQTVGTTVGFGAIGALIGAAAGGGPGALLGAGLGSVAGLGLSSASHSGDASIPAEALVDFRLTQQAAIDTVSQAEVDRLATTMPPVNGPQQAPQMRRRYYPPYPYGPVAYPAPYPYYYPYYR